MSTPFFILKISLIMGWSEEQKAVVQCIHAGKRNKADQWVLSRPKTSFGMQAGDLGLNRRQEVCITKSSQGVVRSALRWLPPITVWAPCSPERWPYRLSELWETSSWETKSSSDWYWLQPFLLLDETPETIPVLWKVLSSQWADGWGRGMWLSFILLGWLHAYCT